MKLNRVLLLVFSIVFLSMPLSAKKIKWKLAQTWPKNLSPLSDASLMLAKEVEKMTNGEFMIKVDSAEKHKSAFGIFDFVKSGQYDLGHSASYYWKGKDENTLYFTTLPFGMTAIEQYAWFYYGGGEELMNRVYNKYNLYSFPGGNTDVQMGGWFKKEIKSIDDLKNLKMRIPGFAGEVFAKVGAKPQNNIAPGELYTALDRGVIDALEWVGPSMDLRMGFHKIASYYYTGWHEPGSEMQFLVNKKKFDALPENFKAILTTAMKKVAYDLYIKSIHMSALNWAKMKKEFPNIKVLTFPQDVLKALKKANDEILDEKSKKDALSKEIIDSRREYLKLVRPWNIMGNVSYINSIKELQ